MDRIQVEGGRYFVHEHPAGATSWKLPAVKALLEEEGVMAVVADQCEFGLTSRDHWGTGPAKKPTRFLINSWYVAEALDVRCQNENRRGVDRHRHVHSLSGSARKA